MAHDESMGRHCDYKQQERLLCEALWEMRRQGEMCDMVVQTKEGDIRAHGVVLSAASPVLKSVILDQASNLKSGLPIVPAIHTSQRICLQILEFIYTGRLVGWREEEQDQIENLMKEWSLKAEKCCFSDLNASKRSLVDRFSQTVELAGPLVDLGSDSSEESHVLVNPETINVTFGKTNLKDVIPATDQDNSYDLLSSKGLNSECGNTSSLNAAVKSDEVVLDDCESCTDVSGSAVKPSSKRSLRMRINLKNQIRSTENRKKSLMRSEKSKSRCVSARKKTKQRDPNHQSGIPKPTRGKISDGDTLLKRKKGKTKADDFENENKVVNCNVCSETFSSKSDLLLHKTNDHAKKKNYSCQNCKTKFVDKNSLVAHNFANHFVEGMARPKEYICEEKDCNYKTYSSVNFNVHKRKLHLNFRPVCSICGKTYKHAWSLYAHMQNIHPADGRKTYSCHICSKEFKTDVGVQNHMSLIHQLGPERVKQICPQCGYTCWTEATLSEHLFMKHAVHPKNGKTYKCKYCDYEVTQPSTLKKHEQRHNAEKSYKCQICEKTYVAQFDLNKHLRTVHKDAAKLHHCPFCDYTSKWSMSAVREHIQCKHANTHEKRWGCDDCSYRTNSKGNLIKHIRNVHKLTVKTNWTLSKVALNAVDEGKSTKNATSTPTDMAAEDHPQNEDQEDILQQQLLPVNQIQMPQHVALQQLEEQPSLSSSLLGNQSHSFQEQELLHRGEDLLSLASKNVLGDEELQPGENSIGKSRLLPETQSLALSHSDGSQRMGPGTHHLPSVSMLSSEAALSSSYTNEQQGYVSDGVSSIISPMFLPHFNYQ